MRILKIRTEKREIGNIGEGLAAKFLKKIGYKILEKNYADSGNEIDIIAEDKEHIIFVEVKTRTLGHQSPKEPRPASAVTPEKQRKIISAAKYFTEKKATQKKMRFDVIEVYLTEEKKADKILHLKSAFNYDTAKARSKFM